MANVHVHVAQVEEGAAGKDAALTEVPLCERVPVCVRQGGHRGEKEMDAHMCYWPSR